MAKNSTISGFNGSIYWSAKDFLAVSQSIPKEKRKSAYIVNSAFSLELLIKCLDVTCVYEFEETSQVEFGYMTKMTINKGHNYLKIFNHLPSAIKDSLCSIYEGDLKEDLSSVGDAFIDWRYHFERVSTCISTSVLEKLIQFFDGYIISNYPESIPYQHAQ